MCREQPGDCETEVYVIRPVMIVSPRTRTRVAGAGNRMRRSGTPRRTPSCSRSRDRDRRGEMDRGRRDDRERDYHEDRGRPDARDRMPGWGGQRDERDHRGDHDWDRRPLASTGDGRGGAPRPWGGRQFETRYDSQGLQYQSRSEAVHNSGARRDEPQRRYNEPSRLSDEPQRRHDEPSRWRDEPQRRHDEPSRWRDEPQRRHDEPSRWRDEPQRRYDEPSRHHSETADDGRRETLHISGSRTQKRRLPEPTTSTAPTWRAGTPYSQEPGRAPPAPKGAVDGRVRSVDRSRRRAAPTSCFASPQITAQA